MSRENQAEAVVAQLFPVLDRIACAIERLADQPNQKETVKSSSPVVSKQAAAMVWAVTHQVTDVNRIAEQMGVTPRTVRRWSKLRQLLDGMSLEVAKGNPHSGFQTTEGIEAF